LQRVRQEAQWIVSSSGEGKISIISPYVTILVACQKN